MDKYKFEEVLESDTRHPVSFVIDWTIPHFNQYKTFCGEILSNARVIGKSIWRLGMRPCIRADYSYPLVGLFLLHSQPEDSVFKGFHIKATADLGIVGSTGQLINAGLRMEPDGTTISTMGALCSCIFSRDSVKSDTFGVLQCSIDVNGALKLRAEVTYFALDPVETPGHNDQLLLVHNSLGEDYRRLYETKTAHDFVLVSSDGVEKPVHRVVLIARSPVFAAMFDANLEECKTGRCTTEDVNASVLDVLIMYMYCGCLMDDIKIDTDQILLAADKYQLTPLVSQCEQWLIQNMDKATVVDVLLLTDGVTAPALKDAALRHIRGNPASLENGGGLSKLMEKGSADLIGELLKFALRH